jgi:hypothetical protein
MAGPDRNSIFIGYRRDDTADVAGRVYDHLEAKFGAKAIFKDVDSIPVGTKFKEYIPTIVEQCQFFLALIGPGWLGARGEGGRRIDDPEDFVRLEVEAALRSFGVQLLPVLVNGAKMPNASQLPQALSPLADHHAAVIRRDPDFRADVERLIRTIEAGPAAHQAVVAPTLRVDALWNALKGTDDLLALDEFQILVRGARTENRERLSSEVEARIQTVIEQKNLSKNLGGLRIRQDRASAISWDQSRVLILHVPENALAARALAEKLRSVSLRPVHDVPLQGAGIDSEMNKAGQICALWSPQSVDSVAIAALAQSAASSGRLTNVAMISAPVPEPFKAAPTVNLTGWRGEDDYRPWRELAAHLTRVAGMQLPPLAPRPPSGFFTPGRVD